MRSRLARIAVATLLAAPLLGLAAPGTASAVPAGSPAGVELAAGSSKAPRAPGWIYWSTYRDVASCIYYGSTLAYAGSPIYAAYFCEENYSTVGNYFYYELFLLRRF